MTCRDSRIRAWVRWRQEHVGSHPCRGLRPRCDSFHVSWRFWHLLTRPLITSFGMLGSPVAGEVPKRCFHSCFLGSFGHLLLTFYEVSLAPLDQMLMDAFHPRGAYKSAHHACGVVRSRPEKAHHVGVSQHWLYFVEFVRARWEHIRYC